MTYMHNDVRTPDASRNASKMPSTQLLQTLISSGTLYYSKKRITVAIQEAGNVPVEGQFLIPA